MCGLLRSESQCVVYTMSTYECLCRWVNFLPFHLIYSLPSPLSPHESLPFAPFLPSPSLSPPFSLHPPCLPSHPFCLAVIFSHPFHSFSILPSFFNSPFLSLFLNSPFLSLFLNSFTLSQFSLPFTLSQFSLPFSILPSFHSFSILPSFHSFLIISPFLFLLFTCFRLCFIDEEVCPM